MRRTVVTLAVVGLFVACGFPDVNYADGTDGGTDGKSHVDGPIGAEGSGGDDGGDSSMNADTGTDGSGTDGDATADAPGDSSAVESSSDATEGQPTDSGADVHEAATDAPACDKDGDQDLAKGGVCGSTDCDDNDARAYFGEPSFLTFMPTAVTNGDWNCDGTITPQFTTAFSCGVLSLGSCGAASGFTDTPGCGVTSTHFITCKVQGGVLCVVNTTTSNTQGCK